MPSFLILRISMPGSSLPPSRSFTTISDLLRCTDPSDVFASRQIQSACSALVIHIFVPSIT